MGIFIFEQYVPYVVVNLRIDSSETSWFYSIRLPYI